jgi:hypothetical protein
MQQRRSCPYGGDRSYAYRAVQEFASVDESLVLGGFSARGIHGNELCHLPCDKITSQLQTI